MMTQAGWQIVLTFAVYFLVVGVIGAIAYRRTIGIADFVLGGRSLGSPVAALSASASDMSGWLLLGLPGLAYAVGLESLWLAGGLLLGTYLNWRLMAARLRVFTEAFGDALTLPEYLANRFDDRSGLLRLVAAAFILLFFLLYTSSGLIAGGKLFEAVFGLPYVWAVAAGTLALDRDAMVLDLVGYAWAGFGAAFGPVLLLSLYWRRMTRFGALAGIICGGSTVVIWRQLSGGIFDLYELLPGFCLAWLVAWAVSLLDRPPASRLRDRFAVAESGSH